MMVDRLSGRRIETTERHVIRARITGLHRQMPAVVAGHTDLHIRTQNGACVAGVAILLPQMHAVRAQSLRQRHTVIDDERGIMISTNPLQWLCEPRCLMLVNILHPKLKCRHRPRIQRARQPVGKTAADVHWRNQI